MNATDELREIDQIAVLVSVARTHGQKPKVLLIPPHLITELLPDLWPSLDNRQELFDVPVQLAPVSRPLLISFT